MINHTHKRASKLVWLIVAICIAALVSTVVFILYRHETTEMSQQLPTPTISGTPEMIHVPPSIPEKIFIPNKNENLEISTVVRSMPTSCQQVINPPREPSLVGDIFSCNDFALPGTKSGMSVIAGHSSPNLETWFNRLSQIGEDLVGNSVLLQTAESDSRWLVYTVDSVYTPLKTDLPYMEEIWGRTESRPENRLVIVTCLQDSPRNYVAIAHLTEVY